MDSKTAQRLLSKIVPQLDGCWLYGRNKSYGTVRIGGRQYRAHVLVYELLVGPVPDGMELDHTCNNPPCVCPDHLEPVTHRENMLRGPNNLAAKRAKQTHCASSHPLSGDNLYVYRGARYCRQCRVARQTEYAQRNRPRLRVANRERTRRWRERERANR